MELLKAGMAKLGMLDATEEKRLKIFTVTCYTFPESGVKWSLVEVKSNLPGFSNVKGWVKTEEIKGNKIKSPAVLYVNTGGIPKRETPRHRARTLEAGIRVRRLETRQGWALVRTADKIISHGYVYAWVRESDITAN